MKGKKEKEAGTMARLHNKGRREHFLKNGVRSVPGRAIDVPVELAEFYIKTYPESFILYDDLGSLQAIKGDVKKLTKDNKALEIHNEALQVRIAQLEAQAGAKAKTKTNTKVNDEA